MLTKHMRFFFLSGKSKKVFFKGGIIEFFGIYLIIFITFKKKTLLIEASSCSEYTLFFSLNISIKKIINIVLGVRKRRKEMQESLTKHEIFFSILNIRKYN